VIEPADPRLSAAVDGFAELEVANASFFVEKLGGECSDLQGLRELTVNGLEAIAALGPNAAGRVIWDLDWERFDQSGGRNRKLSVIDTGIGMTPEAMRHYINHLAASSHEHGPHGNFGVGAKIAAGSRNPQGLEYRSWHDGRGALVCFKRHQDGRWGLEPQTWPDGCQDCWQALTEEDKPWPLRGLRHGTQVILHGTTAGEDTTRAPRSVSEARAHWITRYLNGRFLRLPDQVEVLVREHHAKADWRNPGPLRRIKGQQHHLEQRALHAGSVELSDVLVRWWVLDDDRRARRREAALWSSTGHAAALLGDEIYDQLPPTRGGYGRLQDFGIRFGYERVVLYAQPQVDEDRLQANTARTMLLLDHEPLPWQRWGREFTAVMPTEILELQEHAACADTGPRRDVIRTRLAAHLPLYTLSRYRPPRLGTAAGGSVTARGDATRSASAQTSDNAVDEGQPDGAVDEPKASEPAVDLPDVAWISLRDGTRAPGDLDDQAARYHPNRHELTINADFRVICDMTAHWTRRYRATPGARPVIDALVREWFEQTLVEVVLCARASRWTDEQLTAMLSPSSFSAALLPRQLIYAILQKRLAQKLGAPGA
jgi:hypothetical protein